MSTKRRGRPPKAKPEVIRKSAGESDYERTKRSFKKSAEDQPTVDLCGNNQTIQSNIDNVTLDKKLDEVVQRWEESERKEPKTICAKVYRLCPNPRFVMAIPCVDGKVDLSEDVIQVECPRAIRDKLLGKIVKVANLNVGSQNHYYYVK